MTTPRIPNGPAGPIDGGESLRAPDPLERRLSALTEWRDAEPTLHIEALRLTRSGEGAASDAGRLGVIARMRIRPAVGVPVVAAAALVLFAAAQLWSGTDRGRSDVSPPLGVVETSEEVELREYVDKEFADATGDSAAQDLGTARGRVVGPSAPGATPANPGDRSVIRKASIEIQSNDVRADFARAGLLVNEGLGEFIEASSLTGEGAAVQGSLTLRVTADRLSEVLNHLRELGTVATEKSSGDDVTEQVVDLSARLRNEQRVEAELLGLLESRKGAPLKELLDMREQLAKVRERIEQMTAQQDRLGRSVSLATILVILRPEPPADPGVQENRHEASAWDYFGERMAVAWRAGTRALADSAAGLVRATVGGLVWWAALAGAIAACLRLTREARRRAGREPVPAL